MLIAAWGLAILGLGHVGLATRNTTRSTIIVFPSSKSREASTVPDVASTFQETHGSTAKILFYSDWSDWSICSNNCEQTRKRRCQRPKKCGNIVLKETRPCPSLKNRRHKRKCHRAQNRRKHKHKHSSFHIVQLFNHRGQNSSLTRHLLTRHDCIHQHAASNQHSECVERRNLSNRRRNPPGQTTSSTSASSSRRGNNRRFSASPNSRDASLIFSDHGADALPALDVRDPSEVFQQRYDSKLYGKWGPWADCSRTCTTRRYRWCKRRDICGDQIHKEAAYCYVEGSYCQRWIHRKIQENGENEADVDFYVETYRDRRGRAKMDRVVPPLPPNKTDTPQEGSECGVAGITSNRWSMTRIIGGRPTSKGRWPWQVAVLNRYKEAFCGGTLVAPQWVLTAAHCIRKRLYVRIGEHDLSRAEGTEIELRVSQMVPHPSYDSETVDNDVAMLRLPLSVQSDRYRGLACLPKPRQALPTSQYCTIIGWGKRKSSDTFGTDILHEAQVPIVSNDVCRNVYEDYHITNNMFCAGYRRGRMDSCAGDSGGPLLCKDGNKWTIFGITSFGEGCGKRGKYGIYTRLSNYIKWIQRTIKGKVKY